MAEFQVKSFDELTTRELYEIMRARADVFVVEQGILYSDVDGLDYLSTHVFGWDAEGRVSAYLRMFSKPGEPGIVQIGRVLTIEHGRGTGSRLLAQALDVARERLGAHGAYVEAQVRAKTFYFKAGFEATSEEFLENGVPHIEMRREI